MSDFVPAFSSIHPLQSDHDAPLEQLMTARVMAVHGWGQLEGRLAYLPDDVAHHFCCALIRLMLVDALAQTGHSSGDPWFWMWFSGLAPIPGVTTQRSAPASLVAETLLSELARSPWEPLAGAATQVRASARFDRGDRVDSLLSLPVCAVEEAARLAESLEQGSDCDWPLAALDQLHAATAASPYFAPAERGHQLLALPTGPMALEQNGTAPPLWALNLVAGTLVARDKASSIPHPCPGAVRAEALKPWLWPRERAILVAEAACQTAHTLTDLLDTAYRTDKGMQGPTSRLRSTSRAPRLYRLLSGFGPLRPIQIEKALSVSKNGVRDLVDALTTAGLVEMTAYRGQAVVQTMPPPHGGAQPLERGDELPALSDGNFVEFDAAITDIDRLLARSNASLAIS
jgi:hypothetical protein